MKECMHEDETAESLGNSVHNCVKATVLKISGQQMGLCKIRIDDLLKHITLN